MLRFLVLPVSLLLMAQAPLRVPTPPGIPEVTLTSDDKVVVHEALDKFMASIHEKDPQTEMRANFIGRNMDHDTIDPTSLPIIGMALSRNSQDPKACALLKRIEPSAICVR